MWYSVRCRRISRRESEIPASRLPEAYRRFSPMKPSIPIVLIMAGALISGACATKTYVRKQVDPVSGKLDQVASKSDQQGQTLDQTKQSLDQTKSTLEEDETKLSATNERAVSAGNRADDASRKADQANQGVSDLRSALANTVANLDDYKQVAETTVNFKFNSDKLSNEAKMALDQMVADQNHYKRFFVAVEGFTDKVGSPDYNTAL